MSVGRRRSMVDRASSELSVSRQSVLLGVSRGSVYYTPQGESDSNLRLMRAMDEQYLSAPWYGLPSDGSRLAADGLLRGPQAGAPSDAFAILGAGAEHLAALACAPGLSVSVAGFEH